MAYDRYDARRERERGQDRGFFERAGDEISSWFGDERSDRDRHNPERMNRDRGDWNRRDEGDRYAIGGWGERSGSDSSRGRYGRHDHDEWDRERERGRDHERSFARPMDWSSSQSDYRSGRDSDRGMSGGSRAYGGAFTGSDYDRDDQRRPQGNWGGDDYRRTSYGGSSRQNDRHYDEWRNRQMSELDSDYAEYCRERQEHFESDFGGWREKRMQKRQHLGGIDEHMEVVGSDGKSIGKVDKVRGDRIILTKSDSDDGRHRSLDCSLIDSVDGDRICLEVPAEEAKSRLREEGSGNLDRDDEHTTLERSFSGTYSS